MDDGRRAGLRWRGLGRGLDLAGDGRRRWPSEPPQDARDGGTDQQEGASCRFCSDPATEVCQGCGRGVHFGGVCDGAVGGAAECFSPGGGSAWRCPPCWREWARELSQQGGGSAAGPLGAEGARAYMRRLSRQCAPGAGASHPRREAAEAAAASAKRTAKARAVPPEEAPKTDKPKKDMGKDEKKMKYPVFPCARNCNGAGATSECVLLQVALAPGVCSTHMQDLSGGATRAGVV